MGISLGGGTTQPLKYFLIQKNKLTKLNKDLKSKSKFTNQLYLLMKPLQFYFHFFLFNTI